MEVEQEEGEEEEEEEEEVTSLPSSTAELPTPQAEEEMDEALTEMRVKIRTLRRQRKAVEGLLSKAATDLDLTQKEAYALRLQFLQALNVHPKLGPMSDALEVLAGQDMEISQLMTESEGKPTHPPIQCVGRGRKRRFECAAVCST